MTRPALLLLHAFGASGRSWDGFRAGWDGPTLAPDLPGFAGAPPLTGPLSVGVYADWITARLDDVDGPVTLVGWSMGGKLAIAAAARRPERLGALILIAPSPPGPEPMAEDDRARQLAARGDRTGAETNARDNAARPLPPGEASRAVEDWLAVEKKTWRWWWRGKPRDGQRVGRPPPHPGGRGRRRPPPRPRGAAPPDPAAPRAG